MGKPLFVCVKCGQDFTRKYGARRHNKIHHLERSSVIGYTEYIIGRTRGTIPPPTEFPPRLIAIRERKQKMMKNMPAHNNTKPHFTVYPDLTSDKPNSQNDVLSPAALGTQTKKNDPLDDTIAILSEAVEFKNLQNVLSGKSNTSSLPSAYSPGDNFSLSSKIGVLEPHFLGINGRESGSSFLGDTIIDFKKIAIIKGLAEQLRGDGTTYSYNPYPPPPNFLAQPVGPPYLASIPVNQRFEIDTILEKREDIFGFSGIVCDRCLTFEFIPHYFDGPDKDRSVEPTKHTCKQQSYTQHYSEYENNQIHENHQNMLLSITAASRVWTEDKTYIHTLKLPSQDEGEKNEVLTIIHPSCPDKVVKIPLKFVNTIDIVTGSEDHWMIRAIKGTQTILHRYELEDFFLRTRTSTYAIFRVKLPNQSGKKHIFLGAYFVYLRRHYG
jgi:hypothetical protein